MSALDGLRSAGKVPAAAVGRLRQMPVLHLGVSGQHRAAVRPKRVVGLRRAVFVPLRIGLSSPMALIGLPAGGPLCRLETVLAEVAATVDIDFIAGDSPAPVMLVFLYVDVAPVTIITAASAMPAVVVTAYGVAVIMADVVVIVPIIIVGPLMMPQVKSPPTTAPAPKVSMGFVAGEAG